MQSARRFIVKGRVQGVFFRDSTRRFAASLGITGHAVNLDDGNVEVFACGETVALDELSEWLSRGPPMAVVTEVDDRPAEWQSLDSFRTG
jgi:acylphosphatase